MKLQQYSVLEFNLKDAADSIIEMATSNEKDSTASFDLGDSQTATFEIRQLDDEGTEFYLKESLSADGEIYVDDSTEGEYDYHELQEMLTARIQTLDAVTEYPRLPASKQSAIEKALAVLGIDLQKYSVSQPRDNDGKWRRMGSDGGEGMSAPSGGGRSSGTRSGGGGGSRGSGATGPAIPTTDSQKKITQAIDDSSLGPGMKRRQERADVLAVYAPKVKLMNSTYTVGEDGGAVYNPKIKELKARPENYPKNQPFNPRPQNAKFGDFSRANDFKSWASRAEVNSWVNQGDLGARKAEVLLAELYSHASMRQGNGLAKSVYGQGENSKGNEPRTVDRFLEKHKLAGFDVDIHHMIPASLGGSNSGRNLVALTASEHVLAHSLEWSLAKSYAKNGTIKKQGIGTRGGRHDSFEGAGKNVRADNIYRTITMQTTASKRSGNVNSYYKELETVKKKHRALFGFNKALKIAKGKKLVSSDNYRELKLDSSGKPKWTVPKKDVINSLESA